MPIYRIRLVDDMGHVVPSEKTQFLPASVWKKLPAIIAENVERDISTGSRVNVMRHTKTTTVHDLGNDRWLHLDWSSFKK